MSPRLGGNAVDVARQGEAATDQQQGGESTMTVLVAMAANAAIAIAKSVAAVATGSASMVAEAAHSWADTGNQVLLFAADKRGRAPADERHPWGHGREAYVWAMLAALGLFTAGGAVSIWHGIAEWNATAEDTSFTVAYVVLAVAFVFEGISFSKALRQTHGEADSLGRDVFEHALATSDPTLRAVLAEDSAALLGLVVAAIGIGLHQATGNPRWDAVGSILVGVLLCVVAVVLIDRNRRFLTGEAASAELHRGVRDRLRGLPQVAEVAWLRLEFLGPRRLLLIAEVDLDGDEPETHVALQLRELEDELTADPRIAVAVLTLAAPETSAAR